MRRRGVDADPESWFFQSKLQDYFLVRGVDRHGVPHATVAKDLDTALTPFPPVLDDVERQNRTELFDR